MLRPRRVPPVHWSGHWWTSDALTALAAAWYAAMATHVAIDTPLVGVVLPAGAEGFALLAAASALPAAVAIYGPDPASWSSDPMLPPAAILFIPPARVLGAHAGAVEDAAALAPFRTVRLTDSPIESRTSADMPPMLSCPGLVLFTSGSTSTPRPVYRQTARLIESTVNRLDALGVSRDEGLATAMPLSNGQGLGVAFAALAGGAPLGLIDAVDLRAAQATLSLSDFAVWYATPHFVDAFSRCAWSTPPRVPRCCVISSPIAHAVVDAFATRYGVVPRQAYGLTETGSVSVDASGLAAGDPSVGQVLAGVSVVIGESPRHAMNVGETGRVWVRTPWLMDGYGFPPHVARIPLSDGFFATQDLGDMDATGHLRLRGRIDDCIRTRDGKIISLARVSDAIGRLAIVRAVAVVPVAGRTGQTFGAVVEIANEHSTLDDIRRAIGHALPKTLWPRVLVRVNALPRLAAGKVDRRACQAQLEEAARS